MKTLLYTLAACLLALAAAGQQNTENQLIGTWLFDDAASFANLDAEARARFDTIPQQQAAAMKQLYVGRKVTFNRDGSYLQELADGRTAEGNWTYDSSLGAVEITHPQGGVFRQKVERISRDSLVLVPIVEGRAYMLVDRWYFTKN